MSSICANINSDLRKQCNFHYRSMNNYKSWFLDLFPFMHTFTEVENLLLKYQSWIIKVFNYYILASLYYKFWLNQMLAFITFIFCVICMIYSVNWFCVFFQIHVYLLILLMQMTSSLWEEHLDFDWLTWIEMSSI